MVWLVALLSLAITVTANSGVLGPVTTLDIANKVIAPDGFSRGVSLVNGIHPGPVIIANKGDRFRLNVVNKLTDKNQLLGTSIHWHGLHQRGTIFMDGTVGVTQCPIAPGDSFLYTFSAAQAGTFWYHSHFDLQYCDGVRGAVVIRDPDDPLKVLYDVDDESTIITLTEWYHQIAFDIRGISSANSTLINGKGRFVGGPKVDLAIVNVEHGKRYRFRLVSMSCDVNFVFSIDGHPLQVIEADGQAVRPRTVDTIQIFSGQRYSAVVNASQTVGNYWIRALPSSGEDGLNSTFANGTNSAILRYKGAPNADPTTAQKLDEVDPLLETDLHPLCNPFAPGRQTLDGADVEHTLNLTFNNDTFQFAINGTSYAPPSVPVLLQLLSGAHSPHDILPKGSVLEVPRNKVVQVNIPSGLIGGPHPFHLHGHAFSVVKSANSTVGFNFLDPVQRDVVSLGDTIGDMVSIRFRTDNPGPWILRCHINFHMKLGLAIVFAEAPDDITHENPVPLDWRRLCPKWDALPSSVRNAPLPAPTSPSVTSNTVGGTTTSRAVHTTTAHGHHPA